jgi:flagellar motor protein MotB
MSQRGTEVVAALAQALSKLRGLQIEVVGHTDDAPDATGEVVDKLELTTIRALTVVQVMAEAGFPMQHMVAAGHADHRATGNEAPDRRMEIRLTPDYQYLPGSRELEALASEEGR